MAKRILLMLGLLLLLPAICWFFYKPLRLREVSVAFKNLAEIPTSELRQKRPVTVSVVAPNDDLWRRIRRSWGEPEYDVALISSVKNLQYCFGGINVRATEAGQELSLQPGSWIYGFSDGTDDSYKCDSVGRKFRAVPGSVTDVTLTADEQLGQGYMIVVRPVWRYTKDKLVGVYLNEDLWLIVICMFIVGLGIVLPIGFSLWRARRMHNRIAPPPKIIA